MTDEILRMIEHKDKLYKIKVLEPHDSFAYLEAKTNLNAYSILLQQKIDEVKKAFYHDKFYEYKNDARKTWSTVNDVLARKKVKTTLKHLRISELCCSKATSLIHQQVLFKCRLARCKN